LIILATNKTLKSSLNEFEILTLMFDFKENSELKNSHLEF